MLIHNKDNIEFVTEFPCFMGHPILPNNYLNYNSLQNINLHKSKG